MPSSSSIRIGEAQLIHCYDMASIRSMDQNVVDGNGSFRILSAYRIRIFLSILIAFM